MEVIKHDLSFCDLTFRAHSLKEACHDIFSNFSEQQNLLQNDGNDKSYGIRFSCFKTTKVLRLN